MQVCWIIAQVPYKMEGHVRNLAFNPADAFSIDGVLGGRSVVGVVPVAATEEEVWVCNSVGVGKYVYVHLWGKEGDVLLAGGKLCNFHAREGP